MATMCFSELGGIGWHWGGHGFSHRFLTGGRDGTIQKNVKPDAFV